MNLPPVRQQGILLKRYKRFLADIQLQGQEQITVHCPNSGSMKGCCQPGSPVIISRSDNLKRKYAWTLEQVQQDGVWIGVNTGMTNGIVHEGLASGVIDDFGTISSIKAEVKVSAKSRLDFLIESDQGSVYLEVKNCSLAEEGVALFPDAITARGTKHLEELMTLQADGFTAAVLFCIQRSDARCFAPARAIDPLYADTLRKAENQGVRVLAYQAAVRPASVSLTRKIPLQQDQL